MELPKGIMLGILLFTILFINVNGAGPLKLGAFNIKMFGWSKYSTSWTKKVIQQVYRDNFYTNTCSYINQVTMQAYVLYVTLYR